MNFKSYIKSIKVGFSFIKDEISIFISNVGLIILIAIFFWLSFFLSFSLNKIYNYLQTKIDFSIYFTKETTTDEIKTLGKILADFPGVDEVKFVSKDEALEDLKKSVNYNSVLQKAIETLKINPLSDYLIIKANNPEVYENINDYLQQSKFRTKIEFLTFFENKKVINRLSLWIKLIKALTFTFIASVVFLAIILISHLTTLVIFFKKDLIEIFKLLGAPRNFVRMPFYTMFITAGLIGCLIALVLIFISFGLVDKYLKIYTSIISTKEFLEINVLRYNIIIISIVLIISLFATRFSLRKYLH